MTTLSTGTAGPVGGPLPHARLRPLPADALVLGPRGALGVWQARSSRATLPHCLDALETSGVLDNLRRLLPTDDPLRHEGPYRGFNFADSDAWKTLEAAAWDAGRTGEAPHEDVVRAVVDLAVRVQDPTGYLDSHVQGGAAPSGTPYADLRWGHELYVLGHLLQAGIARSRAQGSDDLLEVGRRWADDVADRLAAGEELVCGHPGIETALVELARHTGDPRYLDAAMRTIALRGHERLGAGPFEPGYHQDAVPVLDAREVTGHAVRQLYLLAGVTDVFLETGDPAWLATLERLWDDAYGRRTYVTGGMGSRHKDESFGDPYELPPDRAYAETCAGIASVQWSWRMLLATGQGRYADELERALYNVVAGATSADGTAFFYSNPLHVREGHDGSSEYSPSGRLPWFACACCPPNLARLVASLGSYVATGGASGGVALHLYADADLDVPDAAGAPGRIEVRTAYPADGTVVVRVPARWRGPLSLRVPGWADAARTTLTLDGEALPVEPVDGYVTVALPGVPSSGVPSQGATGAGTAPDGDGVREVRLVLPLDVRLLAAHPRVDSVRGCVALARGPVVHAVEQVDHPGVAIEDLVLDLDAPVVVGPPVGAGSGAAAPGTDGHAGPATLRGRARVVTGSPTGALYADRGTGARPDVEAGAVVREVELVAVPYATWGNRGEGPMRVWIPAHESV